MPESTPEEVPYAVLARLFRDSGIVPFLGAGASVAGASGGTVLPTGDQLAHRMVEAWRYPGDRNDPLSKVAQYLEEVQADRGFLLGQIAEIFYSNVPEGYASSLSRFLHVLPPPLRPRLIITTNYDLLVEMALPVGEYLAVSQVRRGPMKGKFLCSSDWRESIEKSSEILTLTEVDDRIDALREQRSHAVVIYKIHGTARLVTNDNNKIDSVVLTENDYVDFLASDRVMKIPSLVLEELLNRNLLFLGYSLQDWNFRVLLRRLGGMQAGKKSVGDDERKHWAILRKPDMVEAKFWWKRNVNLYDVALEVFLDQLGAALGSSS